METVISILVWLVIVFIFTLNNQKKTQTQTPKTITQGKKPHEFTALLKQILERDTEGKTQEHQSQEYKQSPYNSKENTELVYKSKENTEVVYKSKETKVLRKSIVETETRSSLPAIKSTKPQKPPKPKKEARQEKDEEYKNAVREAHPLTTFLDNSENVRNAFVLSEILKRKF